MKLRGVIFELSNRLSWTELNLRKNADEIE